MALLPVAPPTGAAAGAVAGPVGAAVGAVVGAVAGGYAGKAVAEAIDPTVEDAYWRDNYASRPYYDADIDYDEMAPAYRYGWEARGRYGSQRFEDVEPELERDWASARSSSQLDWEEARPASLDAWNRIDQTYGANCPTTSDPSTRKPR